MKSWLFVILSLSLAACSSNPHKAEKIDTELKNAENVSDSKIGVKDGNLVYQKKANMAEELRDLQYEVYGLEDRVYGNAKYATTGLYGVLKDCRRELTEKKNGGTGKLMWTEPMDRVTDKEEDFKFGIDEKDKIVGVSEEFLRDRITRFREYKRLLKKRNDEYDDKIEICKADLRARKFDMEKDKKAAAPTDSTASGQ